MELLKLTKIDKTIILVMDEHIYHRVLSNNEEDVYDEVQNYVDRLKSGKLDAGDYALAKNYLRGIMSTRPTPEYHEQMEIEERISEETFELARGNDTVQERINKAERISGVNENIEHDLAGLIYLKGHSVPMPATLVEALMDATYNPESSYTVEGLENFWKWAVLNPNAEARNDLFAWFQGGDFTITEEGMVVAYRRVNLKVKGTEDYRLWEFVKSSWDKIRGWKKSPKNYTVYQSSGEFRVTDSDNLAFGTAIGNLDTLYDNYSGHSFRKESTYTDVHTGRMTIRIGEEVSMPREDCDSDRNASCSSGLHFMNRRHGGYFGDTPIVILINPMNIVAFPQYDNTKGRCCRYLPIALADVDEGGSIIAFEEGTMSFNYAGLERERIQNLAFEKGFEGMKAAGLVSDEVSFDDFNFIRGIAKDFIKDKVSYVE